MTVESLICFLSHSRRESAPRKTAEMWQSDRRMRAECEPSQADEEIKRGGSQTHTADRPAAKCRDACKTEDGTRLCAHLPHLPVTSAVTTAQDGKVLIKGCLGWQNYGFLPAL